MTYRGEVKGGVVVLEGPQLPDGTVVRVEPVTSSSSEQDDEREQWRRFGAAHFARAYGPDEPEYTMADVKRELEK